MTRFEFLSGMEYLCQMQSKDWETMGDFALAEFYEGAAKGYEGKLRNITMEEAARKNTVDEDNIYLRELQKATNLNNMADMRRKAMLEASEVTR